MKMTDEQFAAGLAAAAALSKPTEYIVNVNRQFGRLRVRFEWRRVHKCWGRFGGGWNWILGVQFSGTCLVLNLLVCSLTLQWKGKSND